jgi:hypothetical protein
MNISLQVFLNPPNHLLSVQQNAARYIRGDVIGVYETKSLADFVDGEYRHKDVFINKWVFLHVTETPYTIDKIKTALMNEVSSVAAVNRKRKMMIDPANISDDLYNKLSLQGEVTVTFDDLFSHIKNKQITNNLDASTDSLVAISDKEI